LRTLAARPRELALVSLVALSAGFAAGWWLARQDREAAPHAVGPAEHAELGARALEAGDLTSAERHFREVARLEPETARARADLAAVLMLQGRWPEAGAELELARNLDPRSPETWFLSGMLWRDGYGDTTRARESWERFLTLVPEDSPQAATIRGWLAELGSDAEGGDSIN
jgi:tetratricopeptide (TPR) repeat protein